jgi:2-keto-4-pentenoate hydratase/2-oxohepta-3-ene-1,7-dioic acid hydratase in catechol pathway
MEYVKGFGVMLDITARGIQAEAKNKGLPWSEAKGYDTFAPVGSVFASVGDFDYRSKGIWLSVNGSIRQEGNTDLMLFRPPEIISRISEVMTLEPGDLILTGTPAGVGELNSGDVVKAGVEGICECSFNVV